MCGQSEAMKTVREAACQLTHACGIQGLLADRTPARAQMPNPELDKLIEQLKQVE